MRLFAAIVPPSDVLDHLDTALGAVIGPLRAGRAVRISSRENWHLTTAFFGEVPDGALDDLSGALREAAARARPFDLALAGAGVFGGRVLWLGVGTGADAMRALMRECGQASAAIGIEADHPERNRAHLTIARSRDSALLAEAAAALAVYRGPTWRAGEMTLLLSEPGQGRSGGSRYTPLARFALAGPERD